MPVPLKLELVRSSPCAMSLALAMAVSNSCIQVPAREEASVDTAASDAAHASDGGLIRPATGDPIAVPSGKPKRNAAANPSAAAEATRGMRAGTNPRKKRMKSPAPCNRPAEKS